MDMGGDPCRSTFSERVQNHFNPLVDARMIGLVQNLLFLNNRFRIEGGFGRTRQKGNERATRTGRRGKERWPTRQNPISTARRGTSGRREQGVVGSRGTSGAGRPGRCGKERWPASESDAQRQKGNGSGSQFASIDNAPKTRANHQAFPTIENAPGKVTRRPFGRKPRRLRTSRPLPRRLRPPD